MSAKVQLLSCGGHRAELFVYLSNVVLFAELASCTFNTLMLRFEVTLEVNLFTDVKIKMCVCCCFYFRCRTAG